MERSWIAILVIGVLFIGYVNTGGTSYSHGPGVLTPDTPNQYRISSPKKWNRNGFLITAIAGFEIQARVLSTRSYWFGTESSLSPVDFALGWGPMSDTAVLEKITISQGNRFYRWYARELPISRGEISRNSANMHLIPANDDIKDRLHSVSREDLIVMRGYLVRVDRPDGWSWTSSTSRTDTGPGACEVIWVEEISFV